MNLTIHPDLTAKCPRTSLGMLTARIATRETPAALAQEMKTRESEILKLPDPRMVLESGKILAARSGYKALGKDPSRYRGSAEALLRRIISGKSFPHINAVVDVINLVSVETRLPIGLYDLRNVQGDIEFRVGRSGETYKGIGKYELNLEGLPVFCDSTGPHGSPTSDSERTMVTAATETIAAILVSFGGSEGLQSALERLSNLLENYAAAERIETSIVSQG